MDGANLRFRFTRERDHDAPRRTVEALASTAVAHGGMVDATGDHVWIHLHPALPPITIAGATNAVEARASSWPGGPGFHEALIAAAEAAAGEAGVDLAVEDETGFAAKRDRAALEAALERVLRAAAARARDFAATVGEAAHVQLGLPAPDSLDGLRLHGDPPAILTLAGVRDREWLAAAAEGRVAASEFYPWWRHPLDDAGGRRLARALVEHQLTWRPPRTDRQKRLRELALAGLRRGEGLSDEEAAVRANLEALAAGGGGFALGLRRAPRVAPLAGGWSAVVPAHFESVREGAAPPGVDLGALHVDLHTRVESMAQPAPDAPFAERAAHLFAQPPAQGAPHRRDEREVAGWAIERPLADGAMLLLGSLVGPDTHLIVRVLTASGGDPDVARAIWSSLASSRPAPTALFL